MLDKNVFEKKDLDSFTLNGNPERDFSMNNVSVSRDGKVIFTSYCIPPTSPLAKI